MRYLHLQQSPARPLLSISNLSHSHGFWSIFKKMMDGSLVPTNFVTTAILSLSPPLCIGHPCSPKQVNLCADNCKEQRCKDNLQLVNIIMNLVMDIYTVMGIRSSAKDEFESDMWDIYKVGRIMVSVLWRQTNILKDKIIITVVNLIRWTLIIIIIIIIIISNL